MNFEDIILQPFSWELLQFFYDNEPMKSSEVAERAGWKTRQVDAATTKTLIRHGLARRVGKISKVMKKEYNILEITPRGRDYVQWRRANRKELSRFDIKKIL